jgi:hypothetical protein
VAGIGNGGIIQIFLGAFMHTYGVKTSSGKPMSPADIGVTGPVPETVAPTIKAPPRGTTTEPAPSFESAPTVKAPPRGTTTEPAPSFESAPTVKAPPRGTTTEPAPSFESAPTVKAPPRGTTTEPAPSFESAPTVKAPPRGTTTEPPPSFESAPTVKAPPRGTTTEPAPPFESAETIKAPTKRTAEAEASESIPPEVEGIAGKQAIRARSRYLDPAEFEIKDVIGGANKGKKHLKHKETGKQYMFKPESGEVPLVGQIEGIHQHERYRRVPAAAEVAKWLGIETPGAEVVRFGDDLGSLQDWIQQGRTLEAYGTSTKKPDLDLYKQIKNSQLKKDMDVFDYLIANMDRNWGNLKVIVDPETGQVSKLIPIDMDNSFPPSDLRYSLGFLERQTLPSHYVSPEKPIPGSITRRIHTQLLHMKNNKSLLEYVLKKLNLTDKEIAGLFSRLDEILSKVASKEVTII